MLDPSETVVESYPHLWNDFWGCISGENRISNDSFLATLNPMDAANVSALVASIQRYWISATLVTSFRHSRTSMENSCTSRFADVIQTRAVSTLLNLTIRWAGISRLYMMYQANHAYFIVFLLGGWGNVVFDPHKLECRNGLVWWVDEGGLSCDGNK